MNPVICEVRIPINLVFFTWFLLTKLWLFHNANLDYIICKYTFAWCLCESRLYVIFITYNHIWYVCLYIYWCNPLLMFIFMCMSFNFFFIDNSIEIYVTKERKRSIQCFQAMILEKHKAASLYHFRPTHLTSLTIDGFLKDSFRR